MLERVYWAVTPTQEPEFTITARCPGAVCVPVPRGDARCRFLGCQPLCSMLQWVLGAGWDSPTLLLPAGITQKCLFSLG